MTWRTQNIAHLVLYREFAEPWTMSFLQVGSVCRSWLNLQGACHPALQVADGNNSVLPQGGSCLSFFSSPVEAPRRGWFVQQVCVMSCSLEATRSLRAERPVLTTGPLHLLLSLPIISFFPNVHMVHTLCLCSSDLSKEISSDLPI